MNRFEKEILADIGKLQLFVWRTRNLRVISALPADLKLEHEEIMKKYAIRTISMDVHRQVNNLLRDILIATENDLKSLDRHTPIESTVKNGYITEVQCLCGKITKYKVPLRLISDFKCPKESHDEANRRRTSS